MKEVLKRIREPDNSLSLKRKIINSFLLFLFGLICGIFAKWLDNLSINDSISWQHFIGVIDLRNILSEIPVWLFLAINISIFSKTSWRAGVNVFLFFLGMTVSYHIYTILFSGFNPNSYMLKWYIITCISPLLAYICWYAKSKSVISMIISSLIIAIMISICLNIGFWYFDISRLIYLVFLVAIIITLHVNLKNTLLSIIIGLLLSFLIPNINTIIYGLF